MIYVHTCSAQIARRTKTAG